jgi:probable rRNA maturation factor
VSQRLALSQRTGSRTVNLRCLRKLLDALLGMLPRPLSGELGVIIVDAPEITRINETFLRHTGPTDVISFSYAEPSVDPGITGEILVCLPEARRQAQRFGVAWQNELLRYVIHGLLHLCDYDDQTPAQRSRMKQEEDRLLRALESRFPVKNLAAQVAPQGTRSGRAIRSPHKKLNRRPRIRTSPSKR